MTARGPRAGAARWGIWLCVAWSAPAWAQVDGGVAPDLGDATAEGKRHFVQGVALYNDGNFNAALSEFEAANRAHHEPVVLYNIGLCQKGLFRYTESIDSLNAYLTEATADPKGLAKERKAEVDQMIAEMTALLVDLTLTIIPDGAAVIIDGRAAGASPLAKLQLAAGHHVLELSADGYKPARREIELFAGMPAAPMTIKLDAIPRTGRVHLAVSPNKAAVNIDGKPVISNDVELLVGGHTVEAAAPGYLPRTIEISVAAGQSRDLAVTLEKKQLRIWTKWWFWTAAAVVLGGVATAIAVPLSTTTEKPLAGSIDTRAVQ